MLKITFRYELSVSTNSQTTHRIERFILINNLQCLKSNLNRPSMKSMFRYFAGFTFASFNTLLIPFLHQNWTLQQLKSFRPLELSKNLIIIYVGTKVSCVECFDEKDSSHIADKAKFFNFFTTTHSLTHTYDVVKISNSFGPE